VRVKKRRKRAGKYFSKKSGGKEMAVVKSRGYPPQGSLPPDGYGGRKRLRER
jgi:hypothetical protein